MRNKHNLEVTSEGCVLSGLKPMQSAAGWYVGIGYMDIDYCAEGTTVDDITEEMCVLPWARESGYFATKEEVERYMERSL